ncbi:MAG: PadR family transcriptional regulator [Clostridia bacterium]|nr:PadR family transcriptional regulator [Clostridia bacterium]
MSNFEFLKGNIEVIILNALYDADKYGYEIARDIKDKTHNSYEIKQPTLYAYLRRLESQGLIMPYWGEESSGGRRKYFKLTSAGKQACENYNSEWKYHREVLDKLVVDDDEIETATQDQVTPLFGTKAKKVRRPRELPDLVEQLNLSQKLTELSIKSVAQHDTHDQSGLKQPHSAVGLNNAVSTKTQFDDSILNQSTTTATATQSALDEKRATQNDREYNVGLESIQPKPYFPPYTPPRAVIEPKQPPIKPQQTSFFDQVETEPQHKQDRVIIETDQMRTAMDRLYGRDDTVDTVNKEASLYTQQLAEEQSTEGFKRCQSDEPVSEIDNFFSQKIESPPIATPMSFEESTEGEYEFEDYFAIDKSNFFETFNRRAQEIIDRNYQQDYSQEEPTQQQEHEEQPIITAVTEDSAQPEQSVYTEQPITPQEREVVEEQEPPIEKNYKHFYKNLIGDQLDDESLRSIDDEEEEKSITSTNPVVLEELADDLNRQGVKIKLYNKSTADYTPQSMLFTNKINCLVAWITYISIVIEMLIVKLIVAPLTVGTLFIHYGIVLVAPVILTVIYLVNPSKRVKPNFDFKYHLINAIIAFCIATVLIFALNVLLAKIVFTDVVAVAGQIVLPVITAINIPLYIIYYKLVYKSVLKS